MCDCILIWHRLVLPSYMLYRTRPRPHVHQAPTKPSPCAAPRRRHNLRDDSNIHVLNYLHAPCRSLQPCPSVSFTTACAPVVSPHQLLTVSTTSTFGRASSTTFASTFPRPPPSSAGFHADARALLLPLVARPPREMSAHMVREFWCSPAKLLSLISSPK
jgi:hypothetical protein